MMRCRLIFIFTGYYLAGGIISYIIAAVAALFANTSSFYGQYAVHPPAALPGWLSGKWPKVTSQVDMPSRFFTLRGLTCTGVSEVGDNYELTLWEYRFGWPLRCVSYCRANTVVSPSGAAEPINSQYKFWVDNVGTDHGVIDPFFKGKVRNQIKLLPITPVLSGFILNSLLFGTLLSLPFHGRVMVRTLLRKRRGACITCGYPAVNLEICPECGTRK